MLKKTVGLNDPEKVREYIARHDCSNAYKESLVNAYAHYVKEAGLKWNRPFYKRPERLPTVPTTEQVNKVIAAAGKKYGMIFCILRDTGLRPVELERLTLKHIDLESGVICPDSAKGGTGRALKLKSPTLAMLKEYVLCHDYGLTERIFPSSNIMTHVWMRIRNRLATKLKEPELKKYRLYDLRHYYATMLYHRTKDILHVKEQLGHRRLENTLKYTHLVDFHDDEYVCRTAKSVKEASELIESGFEFVTDVEGAKLFRKRK